MNANTINSKNVISGVNDLATKCPKISAMWSSKNTYTPSEVSVGSNKKAWFVCPDCKQEFEARVFHVARSLMRGNIGCPDRKSTRLNSSHAKTSRMPSSA